MLHFSVAKIQIFKKTLFRVPLNAQRRDLLGGEGRHTSPGDSAEGVAQAVAYLARSAAEY